MVCINMLKRNSLKLLSYLIVGFILWPFLILGNELLNIDFSQLSQASITQSVSVTVLTSVLSMIVILVLGLPVSYYVSQQKGRRKAILDFIFQLPMMLPPAVIGLILLMAYGNQSQLAKLLQLKTSFTPLAVTIVFTFVALPVFIKGAALAFEEVDEQLITTARLLGDSKMDVFKRITFPIASRGIIVATILAFSRGVAEFGATIMFAGNLKGVTQTMPLAIYSAMETNMNEAIVISVLLLTLAFALLQLINALSKRGPRDVNHDH